MLKGIEQDILPEKTPEDKYFFAMNVINTDKYGSVTNEDGMLLMDVVNNQIVPGIDFGLIGILPVEDFFVAFSTDKIISVYKDNQWKHIDLAPSGIDPADFFFDERYPIKAAYRYNTNYELLIAFTDNYNPPRLVNIGNPNNPTITLQEANNINDTLLFPDTKYANITSDRTPGGEVKSGVYQLTYAYVDNDGSATAFCNVSNPISISADGDTNTTDTFWGTESDIPSPYKITFSLTGLDTRFSYIRPCILYKLKGVTRAKLLNDIAIVTPNLNIDYTNNETYTDISLEEVLIKGAKYSRAKAITSLGNRLYIGNLSKDAPVDFQQYANNITIKWTSELVNINTMPKDNPPTGFMHGEVYAFYITLIFKNGEYASYHIPGRVANAGETAIATDVSDKYLGISSKKRYQVTTFSNTTTRDMSYWENYDEDYPTTGNFPVGKVRHHKFPDVNWMYQNVYHPTLGAYEYLTKSMDKLGIEVSGVVIPSIIQEQIQGWTISYARKGDYNNITSIGIDRLQFSSVFEATAPVANPPLPVAQASWNSNKNYFENVYTTSGGNYNIDVNQTIFPPNIRGGTFIHPRHYRINHPDLLIDRAQLSNLYIKGLGAGSVQLFDDRKQFGINTDVEMVTNSTAFWHKEAYGINGIEVPVSTYTIDTMKQPSVLNGNNLISAMPLTLGDSYIVETSNQLYTPVNLEIPYDNGRYMNYHGNTSLVCKASSPLAVIDNCFLPYNILPTHPHWFDSAQDQDFNYVGGIEPSPIVSLHRYLDNVHFPFYKQQLVFTGTIKLPTDTNGIFEGEDCFISQYQVDTTGASDYDSQFWSDVRNIVGGKRYLITGRNNYNLRYYDPAVEGSEFYPAYNIRTKYTGSISGNIADRQRALFFKSKDFNRILYNRDYSSVNDLEVSLIVNPYTDYNINFPYRVHRSVSATSEEAMPNWKSWKALDYYEQPRDKGVITNLQGFNNKLIIHHEESLFITEDKTELQTDVRVVLGTGDIFALTPRELIPDVGYAGTKHPQSCVVNKLGYCFVSADTGKVFILNDTFDEISSLGLRQFYYDNLSIKHHSIAITDIGGQSIQFVAEPYDYIDETGKYTGLYYHRLTKNLIDSEPNNLANISPQVRYSLIPTTLDGVVSNIHCGNHYNIYGNTQLPLPSDLTKNALLNTGVFPLRFLIQYEYKIDYDNPYQGCGYSIAYDEKYNRLILSKIGRRYYDFNTNDWVDIQYYPEMNRGVININDKDFISKVEKGDVVIWQNTLKRIT